MLIMVFVERMYMHNKYFFPLLSTINVRFHLKQRSLDVYFTRERATMKAAVYAVSFILKDKKRESTKSTCMHEYVCDGKFKWRNVGI